MNNSWRTTLSCFPARFLISKKKRNASKFLSRCAPSWRKRWGLFVLLFFAIATFLLGSDKGLHPGRSQQGVESSREEGVEAGSKTRSGASSKLWGHHFVQRYLVPRLFLVLVELHDGGAYLKLAAIFMEKDGAILGRSFSRNCLRQLYGRLCRLRVKHNDKAHHICIQFTHL